MGLSDKAVDVLDCLSLPVFELWHDPSGHDVVTVIPVTPVQSYPSRDISTLSGDLVRINKIFDKAKRPLPVLDSVTNLLCIMFYFPAALPALLPVFTVLYSCDLSKNACWLLLFGIKLFWRSQSRPKFIYLYRYCHVGVQPRH